MTFVPSYPSPVPSPVGRPNGGASSELATKAWVRALLDAMPHVCNWASGTTPAPAEWEYMDRACKPCLRRLFGLRAKAPAADSPASALDALLPCLGVVSQGGNPFEKRYAYGSNLPSDELQRAMGLLVPGSIRLLRCPPPHLDPWLYVALDFVNPWTGLLFVTREISPDEFDEDLLEAANEGELKPEVDGLLRRDASTSWRLGDGTASSELPVFARTLLEAAACALFPSECEYQAGREDAIERLQHWATLTPYDREHSNRWPPPPITCGSRGSLKGLSNAIAAFRLSRMHAFDFEVRWCAALWLRCALDGACPDLDAVDRQAFYRPARQNHSSLQGALEKIECWYPELPLESEEKTEG